VICNPDIAVYKGHHGVYIPDIAVYKGHHGVYIPDIAVCKGCHGVYIPDIVVYKGHQGVEWSLDESCEPPNFFLHFIDSELTTKMKEETNL
jgi:hypothetical protein